MKNKNLVLFLIIVVGIGLFSQGVNAKRVIMKMPNATPTNYWDIFSTYHRTDNNINVKRKIGNLISVEATANQIRSMEKRGYKFVGPDLEVHAFLQDSVNIINATTAWSEEASGESLNGSQVSVCVIDTGVDSDHPDLKGKVIAQKCFCSSPEGTNANCCYGNLSESDNATDDNGHGTHVAGIIAASGGINGIAKGANIVAVKVLNSNGTGSSSDVAAAVKWCSNETQVKAYNISVISMSLGGGQYPNESNCSDYSEIGNRINTAVAENISVVVATGNTNNIDPNATAGISSPACLPNVTRVSATDKSDVIASYAFRNSDFSNILLAPGTDINSTEFPNAPICQDVRCNGNYAQMSGTSMATPMVAGAIAILNQYLKLTHITKTPSEIRTILNETGKPIFDSLSGGTYSRINIYNSLLYLDDIAPNVTLIYPTNNGVTLAQNQTFSCNATDWQLSNTTLKIWNSTGLFFNETQNLTGTSGTASFNRTELPYGKYLWNCFSVDKQNNLGSSLENYTITIGGIYLNLINPPEKNYTNINNTNFTCDTHSTPDYNLSSVTFYLWNASNTSIYNLTKNISGTNNSTTFNYTFENEGNFYWNCLGEINNSNTSWSEKNFSIVYDTKAPSLNLTLLPSDTTSNSVEKIFGFNISNDALAKCELIINGKVSLTNSSLNNSTEQFFKEKFTPNKYTWNINCSDLAGNINSSSTQSFIIKSIPLTHSSSGGGGGGSVSLPTIVKPKTYVIELSKILKGYTKILQKDDRLNFTISNLSQGQHSMTINNIKNESADITVRSNPINITLQIGQSVKLNLSSALYYDLIIKLDNITKNKAKFTLKIIRQPIKTETVVAVNAPTPVEKPYMSKAHFKKDNVLVIIMVIFTMLIIIMNKKKLKTKNNSKKHEKET